VRRILLSLALGTMASLSVAAHADSISYTFDLKQTNGGNIGFTDGQIIGSGNFTIVSANSTPGTGSYFAPTQPQNSLGAITCLDFTIYGMTFNLTNAGANTSQIQFSNNQLTSIGYAGSESVNNATFYFNDNLGTLSYNLSGNNGQIYDTGIITIVTTAAAPEPSAFILFGTGALVVAGLVRRRLLI
jgi:hypothetical protein